MIPKAHVPLAPYTTFHIGGQARFFIEALTKKDIEDAIAFAREQHLPLYPLGGGSNVLIKDEEIKAVVLRVANRDISFENDGDDTLLIAGAGMSWDTLVDTIGARSIFGIENLAGIPGTLGGAAVQNIGAYGAELSSVFVYADTINRVTGKQQSITASEAAFAYRTSFFKTHRDFVITHVVLRLKKSSTANLSYPGLAQVAASGEKLTTPAEIARAVRAIRAKKFPQNAGEGTAGSFFKNPIIARKLADVLAARWPGLPIFAQEDGRVKVSLAWLLDHALSLKGYATGHVRLYENQPLVIVARDGATARDVDAFADTIAERIRTATGITIEREVETVDEKFFS